MSNTSTEMIAWAKAQVGYHEGKDKSGNWDNVEKFAGMVPGLAWVSIEHQPWCAVFVSAAAHKTGVTGVPMTASVAVLRDYAKAHGRFSEYPAKGAIMLLHEDGSDHTEIIYAWDSSRVYSVGGNTNINGSSEGDGVYLKSRPRVTRRIYGYLLPTFNEYLTSADPKWNGKWGGVGKPAAKTVVAKKAAKTAKAAARLKVKVSLAALIRAAKADPRRAQGGTTNGSRASVKAVEQMLHTLKLLDARWVDGSYGTATVAAYAHWQRDYSAAHHLGWGAAACNGIPGMTSLKALNAKTGSKYSIVK